MWLIWYCIHRTGVLILFSVYVMIIKLIALNPLAGTGWAAALLIWMDSLPSSPSEGLVTSSLGLTGSYFSILELLWSDPTSVETRVLWFSFLPWASQSHSANSDLSQWDCKENNRAMLTRTKEHFITPLYGWAHSQTTLWSHYQSNSCLAHGRSAPHCLSFAKMLICWE